MVSPLLCGQSNFPAFSITLGLQFFHTGPPDYWTGLYALYANPGAQYEVSIQRVVPFVTPIDIVAAGAGGGALLPNGDTLQSGVLYRYSYFLQTLGGGTKGPATLYDITPT